MPKLIKFLTKNIFVLAIIFLTVPSFYRMVKPGIYSMQDFHFFRLYEFDKCVQAFQIPCRWAPDAGLGYGEPLFNFYGQASYALGEVFHLIGFNLVDSLKILFILSLVGSALSMYLLAKKLWGNNLAALLSSVLYLYAPYRAVDVWVRGALPEALSFVLFPLIILAIEKKKTYWLSFLTALLISTHNLSVVMFLPMILVWIVYRRYWQGIWAGISALLLSAYYLPPVLFESKFITLESTIRGYFDFRGHFAGLWQLLISRYWGYGASLFGPDDRLSLSVGQLQWILPVVALIILTAKKKLKAHQEFLIFFVLGWFFVFLTHNQSTFIWETLKPMAYLQFPWRFLGPAVFCFSLASGVLINLFSQRKMMVTVIVVLAGTLVNFSFFKEDIWYQVNDAYFTTGVEWDRQRGASIGDFWPRFGHQIPTKPGDGKTINYFPGWNKEPNENGLITADGAVFKDTPVRKIGNIISLVSLVVLIGLCKRKH